MQAVTISVRLPRDEVARVAHAAEKTGMERSAFLRCALRRGVQDMMFERACDAYRRGEATLSRAAEIAGVSLREMLAGMKKAGLDISYGVEELRKDLEN